MLAVSRAGQHSHRGRRVAAFAFLLSCLALVSLLFAACGGSSESSSDGGSATPTPAASGTAAASGIEGQALAGPQCPVVQAGSPCPDAPIQVTIEVHTPDHLTKIAEFQTDAEGKFRQELPPGDYFIYPLPPDENAPFPFAEGQYVTVVAGQFSDMQIAYDTGIR